jgi:hydrogenase expression/formation protein HypE
MRSETGKTRRPGTISSAREAERILLAHGSGGRLTQALVRELFLPELASEPLRPLTDAALLPPVAAGSRPVLTTDSFVVNPPVFPGGDVGYLSVCGTVNDLVVAGAVPRFLTWSLILEEGAEIDLVAACAAGAARAAKEGRVEIVAGDTKVVPRGKGDRIYITTAGLGELPAGRVLGDEEIRAGDVLLVSGPIGDHGATIMAARHDLAGESLRSDCAPLTDVVAALLNADLPVRTMHDPTRGGVITTCHEVAQRSALDIVLAEESIPVRAEVRAVCELLGLEPLALPCEGRALVWVAPEAAESALATLRTHPLGEGAAAIGHVVEHRETMSPVRLLTALGAERPLDLLSGMDLPRIC